MDKTVAREKVLWGLEEAYGGTRKMYRVFWVGYVLQ